MQRRSIPEKANHILHLFLLALLLIGIRAWYLTTFTYEKHLEAAKRPQQRSMIEKAPRGAIYDRFGKPLAYNRLQYNAAILFADIREIPRVVWEKDERGKKRKILKRRDYIENLSEILGKKLEMEPIAIEDMIYSTAALFPHTPTVIKEEITESQFAQLKMMERKWPGIIAERGEKRFYPLGKVGCDVIGYMGAIHKSEYIRVAHERDNLIEYLRKRKEGVPAPLPSGFTSISAVKKRIKELREKCYKMNDRVGKAGIEGRFEDKLRGEYGRSFYEVGAQGQIMQKLGQSRNAIPGKNLKLSISAEIQDLAEKLLAASEKDREINFHYNPVNGQTVPSPWIKGGAIVVMEPNTGEIVALASYPRYDPNDFVSTGSEESRKNKNKQLAQWLESEKLIAQLWDGERELEREFYSHVNKAYETEKRFLSWETYIDSVLSPVGSVRKTLKTMGTLKRSLLFLVDFDYLLSIANHPEPKALIEALFPEDILEEKHKQILKALEDQSEVITWVKTVLAPIENNLDKLLFIDILRLLFDHQLFDKDLLAVMGHLTLSQYRDMTQRIVPMQTALKHEVKTLFHRYHFPTWRKNHFREYLKKKRQEEMQRKTYQHSYTEYLNEAENILFREFWRKWKELFMEAYFFADPNLSQDEQLRPFLFHLAEKGQDLDPTLKEIFCNFERHQVMDLLKTIRSYQDLTRPLYGSYNSLRGREERHLAAAFYPRYGYGFGRSFAFRQAVQQGSIFKIVTGYEALRQTYEKTHQSVRNPMTIIDEVQNRAIPGKGTVLGFTEDGKPITRIYKGGRLPKSFSRLGKIGFETAMQRTSNLYFELLTSEILSHPDDLKQCARELGFGQKTGIDLPYEIRGMLPNDLRDNRSGLYAFAIGQHQFISTPLQTAVMLSTFANGGQVLKPLVLATQDPFIRNRIFLPDSIREFLLNSLYSVVWESAGSAHPWRIRSLYQPPYFAREFRNMEGQFVGKTSTAERNYRPFLDREGSSVIVNDCWFGAISFENQGKRNFDHPDLVVAIYLKFGDYGKEAAPLAAQIIKRWREIRQM